MKIFSYLLTFLAALGRPVIRLIQISGQLFLFALEGTVTFFWPPYYPRMFIRSLIEFAWFSLPVVALTAIFTGMVLALQSYSGFIEFGSGAAQAVVAKVVAVTMARELGPVLAGLMVAGRVGAAIAAETGTMRVTDQIDALGTLSVRGMKYLVAPRLIAGILALPFLVLIADILGVMGGYIMAGASLGFNTHAYLADSWQSLHGGDIRAGLIKAAVFGFLISLSGCFHGYKSKGGAQGVGRSTTSAVVMASVLILSFDFVLTKLLFVH